MGGRGGRSTSIALSGTFTEARGEEDRSDAEIEGECGKNRGNITAEYLNSCVRCGRILAEHDLNERREDRQIWAMIG